MKFGGPHSLNQAVPVLDSVALFLIIQSNEFNTSTISTLIVAVITSNLALASAPGNLRISKSASGLPKASVINVSQLITLDKSLVTEKIQSIPNDLMNQVETGLRLVLSL